jgi:hypothetical protein
VKKILFFLLLASFHAHADESVPEKVGNAVKKGGEAAGRGIEKAADATGCGIKKGGEATVRGLKTAGRWVEKKLHAVDGNKDAGSK